MQYHWLSAALLMASSTSAFAQSVSTPVTGTGAASQPVISAKNGQGSDQLERDRYECHGWATSQSGFDPSLGANQRSPSGPAAYRRAFSACMEGRGYEVRYGEPVSPAPAPPAAVTATRTMTRHDYDTGPELKYRPLEFAVEGGYTAAAGRTGDHLDDGATGGLGLTWFPSPALPVGIRVDGSYSRFDMRHSYLSDRGYSRGHENLYGGDADLQVDLAKSTRNKLYVFGGAGEYQEQVRRHQPGFGYGNECGYFGCAGFGAVDDASERRTTGWRLSYNAGLGFETAIADRASLFVEARYQRIAPGAQFVPVRVGFRF
jgi:hypothetical protein